MLTILLFLSTITDGKLTDESRVQGAPNTYLFKEYDLTVDSPPVDFVNAFMPKINQKKEFRDKTPYSLAVDTMCLQSNEKAWLMSMVG